jgi:Ca2+-binding EF-hand superfamily protein
VDFGEFIVAYVNTTNGVELKDKLNYVFKVYDRDNNKVLDRTEIATVLKGMLRLMNVQNADFNAIMENIMESLDINHDTKISKEEFINGLINDSYLYAMLSPFS